MKKYLSFVVCLFFAGFVVSCSSSKKKDPNPSFNAKRNVELKSDTSTSADAPMLVKVGMTYTFIVSIDTSTKMGKVTIKDIGSGVEKSVDSLNISVFKDLTASERTSLFKTNALEFPITVDGDNQKTYVALGCDDIKKSGMHLILYHANEINFADLKVLYSDESLMACQILNLNNKSTEIVHLTLGENVKLDDKESYHSRYAFVQNK
jgi:hypothetical protein